jgi:hypothetical protein
MSYETSRDLHKPFWMFAGDWYYPSGGMDDYIAAFDSLEEAREYANTKLDADWYQVIDRETGQLHEQALGWKPYHKTK